ncbi:hypothetical protein [Mycobacterium sp. 29Ha]|uniref:hypothetical protein n=1 Tax=Mycobacterium sp. 29Ha TaxID=2939268 RepID=UPI002938D6B8|nr:hypothetical protein [Mycobacterium sp. 29Ha]MDV3135424.1 hypothetical protein [Mycobacterium sp. 29Ha]
MTTTTTNQPDRCLQFLDDYCPQCNPAGHRADSRVRRATLTEPTDVTAGGGAWAVCRYECGGCGHQWLRDDLFTVESAGLSAA